MVKGLVFAIFVGLAPAAGAWAAEPAPIASLQPAAPQAVPVPPSPSKKKGKASRDKETEGTEAANRFEADTVIKSRYQLNGEPLEVDPD